jgi:tight adherence protein B
MRKATAALAAGVGVLLALSAVASAAPRVQLVEAGHAAFPDREYVLSLPKRVKLAPGDVKVWENGHRIRGVTSVQAEAAVSGKFGVVLVIDTSQSMQGRPIRGAVAAARAFAEQRAPTEKLGLVTYNDRVRVELEPTADATRIAESLATTPGLAFGTHTFDAAQIAISLLRAAKVSVGSVVLLSDGADTGSRLQPLRGSPEKLPADPLGTLLKQARAAHVRIFTVGLHSPQFRPATLRSVARGTGGAYVEATSPSALTGIYRELSQQLASEYLIQYQSPASPGQLVRVKAEVRGFGTAVASYRTPTLAVVSPKPFHRSVFDRFWMSAAAVVIVSLLAGGLAAFALYSLVRGGDYGLRQRIGGIVAAMDPAAHLDDAGRAISRSLGSVDRALDRSSWGGRLLSELEIAEIKMPAGQIFGWTALASVLLALLLGLVTPVLAIFGLVAPALVARLLIKQRLRQRREAFADQLIDNLNVLASALRAGHSFIGALSVMLQETEEPSRSEFGRAVGDEQLGVPVEEALVKVAERMENADLEQVALVAQLQRQTGGNTAAVLDTVVEAIRDRRDLRRTVQTLTAQGRLSGVILVLLPIGLTAIVSAVNPTYMKPLFTTGIGQLLLVLAAILVILGSVAISRIVNIKV